MAFPTTGILDNFNRANEGPPPSASWTNNWAQTSGGETLVVDTNQLAATASGDAWWNVATYGPDEEVYITVVTLPVNSFRLALRMVDADIGNTDCYQLRVDPGSSNIVIGRMDDRIVTALGAPLTMDVADGNKVGFEAVGNVLSYYRDGGGGFTFIDSRSDATYSAAGYLGVRINDTTTRLDNFGGGTVGGAPAPVVVMTRVTYT